MRVYTIREALGIHYRKIAVQCRFRGVLAISEEYVVAKTLSWLTPHGRYQSIDGLQAQRSAPAFHLVADSRILFTSLLPSRCYDSNFRMNLVFREYNQDLLLFVAYIILSMDPSPQRFHSKYIISLRKKESPVSRIIYNYCQTRRAGIPAGV